MKYQTTRKALVAGTVPQKLISAGYCELQTLLTNHEPIAYNAGDYGWNFDVYHVYGLTICTGYRNMPGRSAKNADKYNRLARVIDEAYANDYTVRKAHVEEILKEFCAQA